MLAYIVGVCVGGIGVVGGVGTVGVRVEGRVGVGRVVLVRRAGLVLRADAVLRRLLFWRVGLELRAFRTFRVFFSPCLSVPEKFFCISENIWYRLFICSCRVEVCWVPVFGTAEAVEVDRGRAVEDEEEEEDEDEEEVEEEEEEEEEEEAVSEAAECCVSVASMCMSLSLGVGWEPPKGFLGFLGGLLTSCW